MIDFLFALIKVLIGLGIGALAAALTGWPLWLCCLMGVVFVFGGWFVIIDGDVFD